MESDNKTMAKQICIWADGCYDGGHFGHANNLRQAKALGDKLIVGVHSDKEIYENKNCYPLFNEKERYAMIGAIKWVDQVIQDAPYVTTLETLDQYGCEYCAHGNDITTTSDGTDTYHLVKSAGKYKEVERTRGVSTTDIINRILESKGLKKPRQRRGSEENNNAPQGSPWTGGDTQCLLSTDRIKQFTANYKDISKDAKVVYASGAFDMLHPGHLGFLEEAKKQGDYLIVGVHDDDLVRSYSGFYPIMTLNERFLSLLGCKYVDEVILGAPYSITKDLLEEFRVNLVVNGEGFQIPKDPSTGKDPYELLEGPSMFKLIKSSSELTTGQIIQRVVDRKDEFILRNEKKEAKERASADAVAIQKAKADADAAAQF